jgi:signal transduction histidine kinase
LKVFDNGTRVIVFIIIASSFLVGTIAIIFTQSEVTRTTDLIVQEKESNLSVISDRIELRIEDAVKLVQLAGLQDAVRNVSYADSVSEKFMGIPPDLDSEKRQIAKDLLSVYPDFETMAFVLPNGDIYFVEPYAAQQNLPRLNFAYREWYQGVIANGDTYIGEAVISAATGHKVVPVAVGIYAKEDPSKMSGILVGALDLDEVQKKLRENELETNEYVLVADHKGSIVADSRIDSTNPLQLQSALDFNEVSKALEGDFGSNTQNIQGVKTFLTYQPVHVGTNNWAIISVQPYDDAFLVLNTISYQAIITIVLVTLVSVVSGYVLYRTFRSNIMLTKRLENLNQELNIQAKKLLQIDTEKAEFSAMITHELKTPLVAVVGYGSLFLNGKLGELSPNQREKFQIMHKSAQRLNELIQDILDVQKLELGKLQLEMKEASAKEMIDQSINSLKPHAESKNIELSGALKHDLKLECDSGRIIQVLNNLLTNAIKFSPNNSTIHVDAKLEDHSAVFSVKDTGIGIPVEKQTRLFTKFYQVDTSLTRKAGGTGLGLVISKGIIEAHKGKIWLASEAGKGSIFSFSVPLRERDAK